MKHTTRLPVIYGGPTVAGQGELDNARRMFELIRDHPDQGRKQMVLHPLLAACAYNKCALQAQDGWTGHVDPEGYGPNHWVRRYGYGLPDYYPNGRANQIESLAHHGDGTPEQTFEGWLNSPGHRIHVLGLDPFYAGQTVCGVGYYRGGEKEHYWCFLSAPSEE